MSLDAGEQRVLLRAEVEHAGRTVVTHTLGLTDTEVFVPLDEHPPLGAPVGLRLSFPHLVEPLALEGVVRAHRTSLGPGDPGGVTVQLTGGPDLARLGQLLGRTAPAAPRPDGYRVLLVDDNGLIRDMFVYGIRKYFRERSGAVVLDLADDGQQAWAKLEGGAYDLAIIDYYLPVLNGGDLIARLRRDPRLAPLAVVAISVGGLEAREASLAAGADLFLHKPIVLKDLFATLAWLTSGGAA